jgi:hypothetical protein
MNGTSKSIKLIYNFENISVRAPVVNGEEVSNIITLFELFEPPDNMDAYNSFPIDTQSGEQQISYSDNITNSPIKYTIKYLHVGISPINFNTGNDKCALIYDCEDSLKNILLIIIPIEKIISNVIEAPNVTNLLNRINGTTNTINLDINKLMPNATFNTYANENNKVIVFNNTSSIKYKTSSFLDDIKNANLTNTSVDASPLSAYVSMTIPQKQTIVAQNDIYIDCYKVGESDKIVGGINIDSQTAGQDKGRRRDAKKQKQETTIALYIFLGIFGGIVFIYLFYLIASSFLPVDNTAPAKTDYMSKIKYMIPIFSVAAIAYTMYLIIRES